MCTGGDASKSCSDEPEPAGCETSCCDDTSNQQCVDYIVGECLPDGKGGCQRSLGVEPCCTPSTSAKDGAKDTCCSADQVTKNAEDACCVESICEDDCCEVKPGVVAEDCASACCDEPTGETESVCKDSCCGDDKSVSDAGACATGCCSGPKPDDDASEKDCCDAESTSEAGECASTCCASLGEKAATTAPDPCCTDKDGSGHAAHDEAPFVAEKVSHHAHDHSSSAVKPLHSHVAHSHSAGPTMRRRHGAHVHSSTHKHKSAEDHIHTTSRKHRHVHKHASQTSSKCGTQSAMSRFYEVACCCLINWANRHRHSAGHTHTAGHKHSTSKEKKKDACCSTKPTTSSGKRATAHRAAPTRGHRHNHHHGHKHGSANAVAVPDCLELGDGKRLTMSLAIEGMDCPSCASKVTRALAKVRSVHDVKVNVFAGQASLAYVEGHTFPTEIAKKASELTGFTCSILETVQANGERSSMRIRIPTTHQSSFDKNALPTGVAVLSSQTTRQGLMLEVEYSSLVIRPREVVAAFERWRGEFSPTPKVRAGDVADKELRNMFRRTGLSSLLCLPVLILSWAPLPEHPKAYGGVMLALTTIIQFYIAAPVYSAGFRSLFYQRVLDMDVLISLSTFTAYIFSAVCYFLLLAGHKFSDAFFETSAVLISLIMLGRLISAYARRRATSALDALYSLQVDTVTLVGTDAVGLRSTTSISAELVHKGDILLVAPGEIMPTDGVVSSGAGFVDESSITGESMPVEKTANSTVTAGTKNGDAELLIRVDRLPSDNTVAEIGNLMLEVQNQRLRVQDLADKIAAWLAPVILVVALVTFATWMAVGMKVKNQKASKAGVEALRYAISVMVVSCPCALVLCVPMVVVIATAVASKSGVLFKSAETIQTAKDVDVVVFDKTGTLTTGVLAVAQSWIADDAAISKLLALVAGSRHPVSQAVFSHLSTKSLGVSAAAVTDIVSLPGQGLECTINGAFIRGGNATWLNVADHDQVKNLINHALTVFAVTIDGALVAAFGLSDTIRPDAQMTVDIIKNRGGAVYIVSGDAQPVVDALAKTLAIPAQQAFGGCLPQDKLARVKQLQNELSSSGKKRTLMFVGDGTNDALALAQANVGVSFTTGTSVAASAAGILLLTPSLTSAFRTIFSISAGATRRIWINFVWSFVYNLLAVLGAAGAFVSWSIKPEYAGLGEVVSVLPVVLIAWSMWMLKGRA